MLYKANIKIEQKIRDTPYIDRLGFYWILQLDSFNKY